VLKTKNLKELITSNSIATKRCEKMPGQ